MVQRWDDTYAFLVETREDDDHTVPSPRGESDNRRTDDDDVSYLVSVDREHLS